MIVNGQVIPITYKYSNRAKQYRIQVYIGGIITVTIPRYGSKRRAELFVTAKSNWLIKKINMLGFISPEMKIYSIDHYKLHREAALALVKEKLTHWTKQKKFFYSSVTIRQTKTRWGSCSSNGRLNFNYKILFLPTELQDYLIVHELCHLIHHNHSTAFWNLVEELIPAYRQLDQRLRG